MQPFPAAAGRNHVLFRAPRHHRSRTIGTQRSGKRVSPLPTAPGLTGPVVVFDRSAKVVQACTEAVACLRDLGIWRDRPRGANLCPGWCHELWNLVGRQRAGTRYTLVDPVRFHGATMVAWTAHAPGHLTVGLYPAQTRAVSINPLWLKVLARLAARPGR
jgi:hypothetical protein